MSEEPNWRAFFQDRERLHARFYLAFAQQHAHREAAAYDRLEAESGNLFKIATWLTARNEAEGILQLATALWQESDFLRSRGFMQRGLPLLAQARQSAHQTGDSRAEFICLEALAYVHYSSNNFALARPLYEQTLALAQAIDEPLLKAQALLGMGRLLLDIGEWDRSATLLKQALQEYRQIQEYAGEIETLAALGNLLSLQGNFVEAVVYIEQGIPLARSKQDLKGEASLRYALGYTATLAQEWPRAIDHFEAATDLAQTVGDLLLEVRGLTALGEVWLAQGDIAQAVMLLEKALVRQEISDDLLTKAFTHVYLAKAYHALGDTTRSLTQLRQAYPYLLERRQVPVLAGLAAEAAWLMAENYLQQGRSDLARSALGDVLSLAPAHLDDMRQAAQRRLDTIAEGESKYFALTDTQFLSNLCEEV